MALTQQQRIDISKDQTVLPQKQAAAIDANSQISEVKDDLEQSDENLKVFFDKFTGIVNNYQDEQRWVNGTTRTVVVEADLQNAARRVDGNNYFPTDGSWVNFQPKTHPNDIGEPLTTSPDHEDDVLNRPLQQNGLKNVIDFMLNGQLSAVPDDTLDASPYSGGSATLTVTSGGQTVGNFLLLDDGVSSALVVVTAVSSTDIDVDEVLYSTPVLGTGSVIENIAGYTNTERETLTALVGNTVLQLLADSIKLSVDSWEVTINNQLTALNANEDVNSPQESQIQTAITDANNALSVIAAWEALLDTGVNGKFVDLNITSINNEVVDREAFIITRDSEIVTALGTVTQNSDGTYSGTGAYSERFNQIDSRINLAGGPLPEFFEKETATKALENIVTVATNQLNTFATELTTSSLAVEPTGSDTIEVQDSTGFSVSDTVFVVSDTQPELTGTINNIDGNLVTLSFTVDVTYTLADAARLYKQL